MKNATKISGYFIFKDYCTIIVQYNTKNTKNVVANPLLVYVRNFYLV